MVTAGCRGGEKKTPVTARNHLRHVLQKTRQTFYRQTHEKHVDLIANNIHEEYDKP